MAGTQSASTTSEGSTNQESADEQIEFLYDTIVVVLVGPEKQRFDIHKGLICSRSNFFKAAFMGNFKEAKNTIRLPEQDPATFKYFVHWLYTGSLRGFYYTESVNPTLKELTDKVRSEVTSLKLLHPGDLLVTNPHRKLWEYANYRDLPFNSLIVLYLLADKLQVTRLKDASITALVEVYGISSAIRWKEQEEDWKGINMAWETLPTTSNLCQVLLHLWCDNSAGLEDADEGEGEGEGVASPHFEFVVALGNLFAKRWLDRLPLTDWTETGAICSYHEHEGASCGLTEKLLEGWKAIGTE